MPNVALLMGHWSFLTFEAARGAYDYAFSHNDWNLQTFSHESDDAVGSAIQWHADAIITQADGLTEGQLSAIKLSGLPVVNIGATQCSAQFPTVAINPDSVSRLVAQHLQHLSFNRLALVSTEPAISVRKSLAVTFADRFDFIPLDLHVKQLRAVKPQVDTRLTKWLQENQPAVLVADGEEIAIFLRRAISELGLRVPNDVALLSVGDGLGCGLPMHSVTSVILPWREAGYQAARVLHRLLGGLPAHPDLLLIDALHMTCRASSVESSQDLAIERAVKFIDENATRGITVADVMHFQQTSRVTFERQFLSSLGCTPGEYIRQIKVTKAKQLLKETNQSIEAVGKLCGYKSSAKFSSFFKRAVGVSPIAFRQLNVVLGEPPPPPTC